MPHWRCLIQCYHLKERIRVEEKHKATLITCSTLKMHSVIVTCQTIDTWHAICEYFAPQSVFPPLLPSPHHTAIVSKCVAGNHVPLHSITLIRKGNITKTKVVHSSMHFATFVLPPLLSFNSYIEVTKVLTESATHEGLNFSFLCLLAKQLLSFRA